MTCLGTLQVRRTGGAQVDWLLDLGYQLSCFGSTSRSLLSTTIFCQSAIFTANCISISQIHRERRVERKHETSYLGSRGVGVRSWTGTEGLDPVPVPTSECSEPNLAKTRWNAALFGRSSGFSEFCVLEKVAQSGTERDLTTLLKSKQGQFRVAQQPHWL